MASYIGWIFSFPACCLRSYDKCRRQLVGGHIGGKYSQSVVGDRTIVIGERLQERIGLLGLLADAFQRRIERRIGGAVPRLAAERAASASITAWACCCTLSPSAGTRFARRCMGHDASNCRGCDSRFSRYLPACGRDRRHRPGRFKRCAGPAGQLRLSLDQAQLCVVQRRLCCQLSGVQTQHVDRPRRLRSRRSRTTGVSDSSHWACWAKTWYSAARCQRRQYASITVRRSPLECATICQHRRPGAPALSGSERFACKATVSCLARFAGATSTRPGYSGELTATDCGVALLASCGWTSGALGRKLSGFWTITEFPSDD